MEYSVMFIPLIEFTVKYSLSEKLKTCFLSVKRRPWAPVLFLSLGWEGIRCRHRRHPSRTGSEENPFFVPGAAGGVRRLFVSLHITWTLWSVSPCSRYLLDSHNLQDRNTLEHTFRCFFLFAGILNDDGTLNNDASCLRLAEVALAYAKAGELCFWFYQVVSNFRDREMWRLILFVLCVSMSPLKLSRLTCSLRRLSDHCSLWHDGWTSPSHKTSADL